MNFFILFFVFITKKQFKHVQFSSPIREVEAQRMDPTTHMRPKKKVVGGVAFGPREGVAARELQKQAAKRKRQRGAEDARNSSSPESWQKSGLGSELHVDTCVHEVVHLNLSSTAAVSSGVPSACAGASVG